MGQNESKEDLSRVLPEATVTQLPQVQHEVTTPSVYIDQFRTDNAAQPYDRELLKKVYGDFVGVYRAVDTLPPQDGNLLISVDDRILVLRKEEEVDWGFATNLSVGPQTKKNEGFVLLTLLVEDRDVAQSLAGWFDVSSEQAEALLMLPGYEEGLYLLRPCRSDSRGVLTLSVRTRANDQWQVRHNVVRRDEGGKFSLKVNRKFASLSALLHDCATSDEAGIGCRLTQPFTRLHRAAYRIRQMYALHKDVCIQRRLEGAGSAWFHARLRNDLQMSVAVRTLYKEGLRDDKFLTQVRSLRTLNHPNVLKLVGVVLRSDVHPHFILFEAFDYVTLLTYLRADKAASVRPATLLDFCVQTAGAMAHLEEHSIVHGDLRAENLLLGEWNTIKVAGFSLAKLLPEAENRGRFVTKWSAPELAKTQQFTVKSDCWSFGILLYEICTRGREPYDAKSATDVQKLTANGSHRLQQPKAANDYCPNELFKLMNECWKTPTERPAFSKLSQDLRTLASANKSAN